MAYTYNGRKKARKKPQTITGWGFKRLSRKILDYPLVPEVGIEPTWGCPRWILSPVRLPVSPLRHRGALYNRWCSSVKKDLLKERGIKNNSSRKLPGLYPAVFIVPIIFQNPIDILHSFRKLRNALSLFNQRWAGIISG